MAVGQGGRCSAGDQWHEDYEWQSVSFRMTAGGFCEACPVGGLSTNTFVVLPATLGALALMGMLYAKQLRKALDRVDKFRERQVELFMKRLAEYGDEDELADERAGDS